ncbi:MAG: type II toxin-antitoxin system RelE/ParE family toxin [Chloroflexi bacterium]|nr:type II toxin-antitoxin system RelE/ParE family toxin [Chloroflexota bacterium]
MPYRVEISPAAGRELRRLLLPVRDRLEPVIMALAEEPRPQGVRKLQGGERAYRIRVGDYRVVYEVYDNENLVVILRVGRRTESTYRRVQRD